MGHKAGPTAVNIPGVHGVALTLLATFTIFVGGFLFILSISLLQIQYVPTYTDDDGDLSSDGLPSVALAVHLRGGESWTPGVQCRL